MLPERFMQSSAKYAITPTPLDFTVLPVSLTPQNQKMTFNTFT
ncbi:hypothetical protein LVISKB_2114 [Levilactobacillus brevis KB290]|uniref:Uncharacterized protein n=1 Tax=Levilactobacillus brevis KB290 TaxID=1001583 RepID=M5AFZ5_LEVBR|nr:hypothetical protein LVISKB_2114 [Levilactobacillus brevis KB290]